MQRTLEEILATHPFFKGLAPEHLELLTGCGSNLKFESGQYLFREGESSNQFFVIREGRLSLEFFTPDRGPVTVQTLGAGDIVGWSWLFPPYRWYADGRAIEPVRAIALDGECLRGKCESDHDMGYEFMKRFASVMTTYLQATRIQLLDLYGVPSEAERKASA